MTSRSFEGTVDENLRLGRQRNWLRKPSTKSSRRWVCRELSQDLENGINTELSVSGYPLSTGQAIRLVLARALIARPAALLIDGLLDRLSDEDLSDVLNRLERV